MWLSLRIRHTEYRIELWQYHVLLRITSGGLWETRRSMNDIWNPWHGCHKISPGCANCYVYRRDESIGKDASVVAKTGDYDLPIKKNRQGQYKLTAVDGVIYTCMTSDFCLFLYHTFLNNTKKLYNTPY